MSAGLQTLQRDGLDLSAMDAAGASVALLLVWRDVAVSLPDADERVLICTRDDDGQCEWDAGWFDGEDWRYCESGGIVGLPVVRWAQPEVPA